MVHWDGHGVLQFWGGGVSPHVTARKNFDMLHGELHQKNLPKRNALALEQGFNQDT